MTAVEIAIKRKLGKLVTPEDLFGQLQYRGFQELPLSYLHGQTVHELPLYHQDPFDRLLIAQASVERLSIITCDEKFSQYAVETVW